MPQNSVVRAAAWCVRIVGFATLALACLPASFADNFPTRPARILSTMAAGGTSDLSARRFAEALKTKWGQPVIVDNRPGAGGNVAAIAAAAATPDGYTFLFAASSLFTVNPVLYEKLPFSLKDFLPLVLISKTPHILLVNSALPAGNLTELIAFAKSKPGGLNFGSGGQGTSPHLAGELFKSVAGINLIHVPYRGGAPMLTALISGEIQLLFDSTLSSIGHIKSGRARGLAIGSLTRSHAIPELPTFAESGFPGFEAGVSHGLFLPAATPVGTVKTLSRMTNEVISDPTYTKQMTELGSQVVGGSPEDFRSYLVADGKRWGEVIRQQGIRIK